MKREEKQTMAWNDLDIEEQWEHFLNFLKSEDYTFELIKDADFIDEDDEISIEYNGRKYSLYFVSPDFALVYKFKPAVDKDRLKRTAKGNNSKNYNISFLETQDKEMNIYIDLLFTKPDDIKEHFLNHLNVLHSIVEGVSNGNN